MITSLSPIDGRYHSKTESLSPYFSEFGLMHYRTIVEIKYFIALIEAQVPELKDFPSNKIEDLKGIYLQFTLKDAQEIKSIERKTNHDVKAVEYFIKNKFEQLGLDAFKEFIHFGLTSQDINNTSIPLSLKDALDQNIIPAINKFVEKLQEKAMSYMDIPLLSRTHGQPASPTLMGKEFMVFVERLFHQSKTLQELPVKGKFGGAVGNFNAHFVTYPGIDWIEFGNNFLSQRLGITRSRITTQIDHYDNLAEHLHCLIRLSTILIDFARDIWTYISMEYFKQKLVAGEVGSSTMPHKVNPIDFENAEGNLGMARAVAEHLANKLPISRLQRDLTDSTVLRNIGVPYAHFIIALASLNKGLDKLEINEAKIKNDLKDNWVVVAEAIQTVLRREGIEKPYELLKNLTRVNEHLDQQVFDEFIDSLPVSPEVKNELKSITPYNYVGKMG